MKQCSISLVTKELPIYTTPLYRQWDGYNPGKGKTTSVHENVEPLEPSYITDENEK